MENATRFDGIILDVDGTIWNTTGIVAVAWNKAITRSGFGCRKVNADMLQKEFGKTMDAIASDLWPELDGASREQLMSYCCTEEQIALRENQIDIMYGGVRETVAELSSSVDFFVVSNCQSGYVELMLEKTGLGQYVRDFECFGNTGKGKSENIQLVIARNGLHAPVYVGDTQGDCDACRQARVPFIWASYGFGEADMYIEKLSDFTKLTEIIAVK